MRLILASFFPRLAWPAFRPPSLVETTGPPRRFLPLGANYSLSLTNLGFFFFSKKYAFESFKLSERLGSHSVHTRHTSLKMGTMGKQEKKSQRGRKSFTGRLSHLHGTDIYLQVEELPRLCSRPLLTFDYGCRERLREYFLNLSHYYWKLKSSSHH